MKVSKRQLRQIIKEEKRKLQEQPMMGGSTSQAIDRELMDLSFKLEEEIDARMGAEDPQWLSNQSTVDAVIDMLDQIVASFTKRSEDHGAQ